MLTDQNVNYLIVTKAGSSAVSWSSDDYLTVTLKSPYHTSEVLVNRVPMQALAGISDIENGMSEPLQAVIGTATGVSGLSTSIACGVRLGCLKMRANESKLEVLYENGAASSNISVAAVFNDDGTDHFVKTLETSVLKDSEGDVDKIYLFKTTAVTNWNGEALNVLITGNHGSFLANAMDVYGATAVLGQIEGQAGEQVVQIFDSADGLHDSVDFQITGTTTNYSVITQSVCRHDVRTSRGVIEAADRIIAKVGGWSKAKYRAYKRGGAAPSVTQLRAVRPFLNDGKIYR